MSQPPAGAFDISCKAQMNSKVSPAWCELARYQQLCGGCIHNDGRKRSKYQIKKDRNK
ncbi:hypothetical protein [Desulfocastanea catecholica]